MSIFIRVSRNQDINHNKVLFKEELESLIRKRGGGGGGGGGRNKEKYILLQ